MPGSILTEEAPVTFQKRVDDSPVVITAGFVLKLIITTEGAGFTVSVAVAVAEPVAFLAVIR